MVPVVQLCLFMPMSSLHTIDILLEQSGLSASDLLQMSPVGTSKQMAKLCLPKP